MFRHELAHIFTIAVRSYFPKHPILNFINYSVVPSAIFSSLSFLEGSAVARESDYGYGRLNDPYTYHLMRRDSLDNKFQTFAKFGGAKTGYNSGTLPYTYGALFNQYLQQNINNFQDLDFWRETGNWQCTSKALKNLTKLKQKQVWQDFTNSLAVTNDYHINTNKLLSNRDRRINSVQYVNDKIYYYNTQNKELRAYDLRKQRDTHILYGKQSWTKVAVSSDEKALLVSGYVDNKTYVVMLRNKTLYPISKVYEGFDDASFLQDSLGFVAINRNSTYPKLTIVDGDDIQTLYKGSSKNYFDSPVVYGDYIYFVHQFQTQRRLSRLHLATHQISSSTQLDYIRFLTRDSQGLSISYADSTKGFYKRAILRENSLSLIQDDIKGEIFDSVVYQDDLYYKSSFHSQDNLMKIPVDELTISQRTAVFSPLPNIAEVDYSYKGDIFKYNTSRDLSSFNMIPFVSFQKAGFSFLFQDSLGANLLNTGVNIEYETLTPEFFLTWKNKETDVTFYTTLSNTYQSRNSILQLNEHHLLAMGFGGEYSKTIPQGSLFYMYMNLSWLGRFTGDTQQHPFTWNHLTSQQLVGSTSFIWQMYTYEGLFGFERFIDLLVKYDIDFINTRNYRTEARIRFSPPTLPLTVRLYSTYDSSSLTVKGTSMLGTSIIPAYEEYSMYSIASDFVAYGDVELMIYSWEIQNGFGFGEFFFNRWAFFGGYRIGYWDMLLQSAYISTQFDFSILYGNLPLSVNVEANYAINIDKWNYKIELATSLPI